MLTFEETRENYREIVENEIEKALEKFSSMTYQGYSIFYHDATCKNGIYNQYGLHMILKIREKLQLLGWEDSYFTLDYQKDGQKSSFKFIINLPKILEKVEDKVENPAQSHDAFENIGIPKIIVTSDNEEKEYEIVVDTIFNHDDPKEEISQEHIAVMNEHCDITGHKIVLFSYAGEVIAKMALDASSASVQASEHWKLLNSLENNVKYDYFYAYDSSGKNIIKRVCNTIDDVKELVDDICKLSKK